MGGQKHLVTVQEECERTHAMMVTAVGERQRQSPLNDLLNQLRHLFPLPSSRVPTAALIAPRRCEKLISSFCS